MQPRRDKDGGFIYQSTKKNQKREAIITKWKRKKHEWYVAL